MDNSDIYNYTSSSGSNFSSRSHTPFVVGAALHYTNLVLYPIFAALMLLGTLLTLILARRANIRGYSSMIYLLFVSVCDIIWVFGNLLPNYIEFVSPAMKLDSTTCTLVKGAYGYGRLSAGLILAALAVERCLVLTIPQKAIGLTTSKAAMLISFAVMALTLILTGYMMYDVLWDDKKKKCTYATHVPRTSSFVTATPLSSVYETMLVMSIQPVPPQPQYKKALEALSFTLLAIVTVILIILTLRKRRTKQLDPIHSSIAAAQKHSNQLNRINLIVCLMVLHYIFAFVPAVVADNIYWQLVYNRGNEAAKIVVQVFDLVNFALISIRVVIILCASPKIRKEALILLGCVDNPRNFKKSMNKAQRKVERDSKVLDSIDSLKHYEDETAASNLSA